ncbi:MAG: chloride channel protein [Acidimicrobiales bacterium]
MSGAAPQTDPTTLIPSKDYRILLVLAALVGVLVSLASWGFLELTHEMQVWVYKDLPSGLGFKTAPAWWPVPVLGVAGLVIAFAVTRLPGGGGHQPSEGLKAGPPTQPVDLPSLLLAAVASVGLGLVLGPEAPLIGLGTGLTLLAVRLARKDAPDQALALLAAAGAFAAISSLFGSPVIAAVIIIEATGLGGPILPVILLPGLIAAGIGSLVFIGMGSLTGLSSSAYAVAPLALPHYREPNLAAFGWTVLLALVAAVVVVLIVQIGQSTANIASKWPYLAIPVAALLVAALAIAFAEITGKPNSLVLFSGQDTMGSLVAQASTVSLATFALLAAFKGMAWGLSLGSGRGGPTFPAMFLGIVGGLLASHLPGYAETPAVAALMGAATVSVLRLPLASIMIALLVSQAGLATAPLIIVAVAVAYIAVLSLDARRGPSAGASTAAPAAEASIPQRDLASSSDP